MNQTDWSKVKEIFNSALDCEANKRAEFLATACPNSFIRQEVEALIQAHEAAGDFIDEPAYKATLGSALATIDNTWVEKKIGPYQVERELGRGGMGVVYLATRADDQYKKQVAIKLVSGVKVDFVLRRFLTERQILATLDHPNIAKLLDGGTTEEDFPYLVMEYIDGQPILEYCDEKQLSITERLKLFCSVCSAIQYAHQNLVIHRDIKPSNILVTPENTPKLLDFGIAKLLNPELCLHEVDQTMTLMRLMTPEYASPEQIRGDKVTIATDVYSLGVVLYELLTGHRPYHLGECSLIEAERIVCETDPEVPSAKVTRPIATSTKKFSMDPEKLSKARNSDPKQLRRILSGDLDNIVMMALRKEPSRRYSSAEQLAADITRYINGFPVIAHKNTFFYRAEKFFNRNKLSIAFSCVIFVIVIVLSSMWLNATWQAKERARLAHQFGRKAKEVEEFLRFARTLPLHNINREKQVIKTQIEQLLLESSQAGKLGQGISQYAIGYGYLSLQDYENANKYLQQAWDYGYREPELAYALGASLGALYQKNLSEIENLPDKETQEIRRKEIEKIYLNPALSYLKMGAQVNREKALYLKALIYFYEKRYLEAVKEAKNVFSQSPWFYEAQKLVADAYLAIGLEFAVRHEHKLALENLLEARKAYELTLKIARSDSNVFLGYCNSWLQTMESEVASGKSWENAFNEATRVGQNMLQADPTNSAAYEALAKCYLSKSSYLVERGQDPQSTFDEVLKITQTAIEEKVASESVFNIAGNVYLEMGNYQVTKGLEPNKNYEQAITYFQKALEINPKDSKTYSYLARVYRVKAAYLSNFGADNDELLEKAIENYQKAIALNLDSPAMAPNYARLANVYSLKLYQAIIKGQSPDIFLSKSVENYQKSIELNPKYSSSYLYMGVDFATKAEYELLRKHNPQIWLEKAILNMEKALELSPEKVEVYKSIVFVYLVEIKWKVFTNKDPINAVEKAAKYINKSLSLNSGPGNQETYAYKINLEILMARWKIQQKLSPEEHFKQAEETLNKALAIRQDDNFTLSLAIDLYQYWAKWQINNKNLPNNNFNKCLIMLKKFTELDPNSLILTAQEGAILALQANLEKAEKNKILLLEKSIIKLEEAMKKDLSLVLEYEPILREAKEQLLALSH